MEAGVQHSSTTSCEGARADAGVSGCLPAKPADAGRRAEILVAVDELACITIIQNPYSLLKVHFLVIQIE